MNTNPIHQFLLLLLGLVSLAAWPQQSAPSGDDASPQVITSQDTSNTRLKTADGVATCPAEFKFRSVPNGVYRVGGNVLPPIPTKTSKPTFSDEARKFIKNQHIKKFEAISVVGVTVDTIGMPQDICVLKEAGHGLDRKAFESVAGYRFIPATIDGKAVPVRVAIEVKFATF
jgi:hypothetical protein